MKPGPKKTGVNAVTYSLRLEHERVVTRHRRKNKLKNRSAALRDILEAWADKEEKERGTTIWD